MTAAFPLHLIVLLPLLGAAFALLIGKRVGKDAVTAYEGEKMASAVLAEATSTGIIRAMCGKASNAIPTTVPAALMAGDCPACQVTVMRQ